MASSLPYRLLEFNTHFVQYGSPFIVVIGTFTNLVNIMVFSRRIVRKNVCSWYFILLSLFHLLLLVFLCMHSIIVTWTGYNMAAYVLSFCKIRQYIFDVITCLSRHFLCLISIDRWMVTSSHVWLRQKSSPRIAFWLIITGILFWSIFNIHSLIQFNIIFNACTASSASTYFFFYSMYTIVISTLPMVIMTVFSALTLRNLRGRRAVAAFPANSMPANPTATVSVAGHSTGRRRARRDMNLVRLSVIQVVAFLIFNSGWCVYPLYLYITSSRGNRTLEERLLSAFLVGLGLNLLYIYAAVCLFLFVKLSFTVFPFCF